MFQVLGIRSVKILSFLFFHFSSPLHSFCFRLRPSNERTLWLPHFIPTPTKNKKKIFCFFLSIIGNSSLFMHAARRPLGAPITHSQPHGQTPLPPPRSQRVDVHEGLDLRLGGMGATHPHARGNALSTVRGIYMGAGAGMDGMGALTMSMPMPMSSLALGMNLGLGGFVGGERESRTGVHKKWKMTRNQEPPSDPRERIKAGRIVILTWACSNCLFYRKLFQDRVHPRPDRRPLRGKRVAPIP